MGIIQKIKLYSQEETELIKDNQENVDEYNLSMAVTVLRVIALVMLLPIVTFTLMPEINDSILIHLLTFIMCVGLLFVCKKGWLDTAPLVAVYCALSVGVYQAIMLSIVNSSNNRATILLGVLCIVPLIFLDRFQRKLFFCICIFVVHSVLAGIFKSKMLLIYDMVNSLSFLCIGNFVGHMMQKTKLNSFELKKKLVHERETDVLTGLKNRRKMFEILHDVENSEIDRPCAIALLDIDHFKKYNDRYGHTAGDNFLHMFGKTLHNFELQYNIKFFRYGGEEFSAFLWGYTEKEQQEILDALRVSIMNMKIQHGRTTSIGYINLLKKQNVPLENTIAFADIALYHAKNSGRNCVICYDETWATDMLSSMDICDNLALPI